MSIFSSKAEALTVTQCEVRISSSGRTFIFPFLYEHHFCCHAVMFKQRTLPHGQEPSDYRAAEKFMAAL